jgi:MraZ protein
MMAWLVGHYEHSLDEKGRITLPAKFRLYFEKLSYLSQHEDGCLALWTPQEFETQAGRKLEEELNGSAEERNKARRWAASVHEVELDKQNRMAIPNTLRQFAQLNGLVIINGMMNRVEFWNPERWQAIESNTNG